MSLILKRDRSASSLGEFYLVYDGGGACVGRIFNGFPDSVSSHGTDWFWGLDFFAARGVRPFYGHAATRELAMVEFRMTWNSRCKIAPVDTCVSATHPKQDHPEGQR